jgi:hypothetical protein
LQSFVAAQHIQRRLPQKQRIRRSASLQPCPMEWEGDLQPGQMEWADQGLPYDSATPPTPTPGISPADVACLLAASPSLPPPAQAASPPALPPPPPQPAPTLQPNHPPAPPPAPASQQQRDARAVANAALPSWMRQAPARPSREQRLAAKGLGSGPTQAPSPPPNTSTAVSAHADDSFDRQLQARHDLARQRAAKKGTTPPGSRPPPPFPPPPPPPPPRACPHPQDLSSSIGTCLSPPTVQPSRGHSRHVSVGAGAR